MRCEQARQLFDAYLDGELSPALETELGTHRLRCASCRRELALLEVTGHVLRLDGDAPPLSDDFTDRLLRCVDRSPGQRFARFRRWVYIGAPMAAAAMIALAFLGVFDGRRTSKVAGVQEVNPAAVSPGKHNPNEPRPGNATQNPKVAFEEWLRRTEENVESGRRTGESLQHMLDNTFTHVLKLLEEAAELKAGDAAPVDPPTKDSAEQKDGVEDL